MVHYSTDIIEGSKERSVLIDDKAVSVLDFRLMEELNCTSLIASQVHEMLFLPKLTGMMTTLRFTIGKLIKLDPLPPTLLYLDVTNNPLEEIPELPSTLHTLNCGSLDLKELPKLPESLGTLQISNTSQIETLPPIPKSVEKMMIIADNIDPEFVDWWAIAHNHDFPIIKFIDGRVAIVDKLTFNELSYFLK